MSTKTEAEAAASALERVKSLIPHRAPFLFVDAILEEGDGRVLTEWFIAPEMDCFRGHYPGQPVLPGVLMTEFALQSGAIGVFLDDPEGLDAGGVPVMTRIEDARFKRMVGPGDTIRAEVKMEEKLSNARYMSAKITRDGKLVARLRFVLAIAPAPENTTATSAGEGA